MNPTKHFYLNPIINLFPDVELEVTTHEINTTERGEMTSDLIRGRLLRNQLVRRLQ